MSLNPDVARLLEILASTAASGGQIQTSSPPIPNGCRGTSQSLLSDQLQPPTLLGGGGGFITNIPGLETVSQLRQQPQQQHQQQPVSDPRLQRIAGTVSNAEHNTQFPLPAQQPLAFSDSTCSQHTLHESQQTLQLPQTRKLDPSTITNWPAALKYVMGILSRDEIVMEKIKRMKVNQDENERRWWASREAIVQKHRARVESKKKVEELLRSIGSSASADGGEMSTAKAEAEELRNFDHKVHKAAYDMERAMSMELSQLGVPFFSGGLGGSVRASGDYGAEAHELSNLRRRMLELLGDMVAED